MPKPLTQEQKIASIARHRTYITWRDMIRRCHVTAARQYSGYGARGITVCEAWRENFEAFLLDMGTRPEGLTIDRVNNDGNYEPGNCRWATRPENIANRGCTLRVRFDGKEMLLTELSKSTGIDYFVLWHRLHIGWTVERAVAVPVGYRRPGGYTRRDNVRKTMGEAQ